MTPLNAAGWPDPDESMDETDFAVLHGISEVFQATDPMPAHLPEQICFSLALEHLDAEVARIAAAEDMPSMAVRGEEQSRTVTFDSDSLTIMIRVEGNRDGTVRLDGWLAPPDRRVVELRTPAGLLTAGADDQGRFAFDQVPRGTAQLVVRPGEPGSGEGGQTSDGAARVVVTPALVL